MKLYFLLTTFVLFLSFQLGLSQLLSRHLVGVTKFAHGVNPLLGQGLKTLLTGVQQLETKAHDTVAYAGIKLNNFTADFIDTASSAFKKTAELIHKGLSVYDDKGHLTKLTLELPSLLELNMNVSKKVFFKLYSRNHMDGVPANNPKQLANPLIDYRKLIFIIAHGWKNTGASDACQMVKNALLKRGDFNVIVVDWGNIANKLYIYAALMVPKVGRHVAKLIDYFLYKGVKPENIRLVGHSLGAHVVGIAGYSASQKPQYIVGLDPALPLFYSHTPDSRISTESAKNVEIIHTNAGLLGQLIPVGHADFFPNGGKTQNGCGVNGACSHSRSYEYFAESINSPVGFLATKCHTQNLTTEMLRSCLKTAEPMGTLKDDLKLRGSFFLKTNIDKPFAEGPKGAIDDEDDEVDLI